MTPSRLVTAFAPDPALIAAIVLSAALYAAGVRRVRRWPEARTAAFAFGLLTVAFALMSGLDVYADRRLTAHMAEHMALTLAAAPLLVVGAPLALSVRASARPRRAVLVRLLQSRAVRVLTHPLAAFTLLPATLLATHLTPFYDLALRDAWLHALEHALYLGAALLFWTPVLGAEPLAHRLSGFTRTAYLVASMPAMSALGAVLVSAQHPLYPTYARTLRGSALADQHVAGALMWVGSALALTGCALAVAWRAWEREERRQAARERAAELGASAS